MIWYKSQQKKCFYCDIPEKLLGTPFINKGNNKRFTIERLDNKQVYILGNIVLACNLCNRTKNNFFTIQEMKEIAQKYIKPKWGK